MSFPSRSDDPDDAADAADAADAVAAREARRLASLRRLEILDTEPERDFDDLVLIASQLFDVPIALVSLVDAHRQWFKAKIGLAASETHRDYAFCAQAIRTPDRVFAIEDATSDPRFATNPLVTGDPNIRFYAGAPIIADDGEALGTVCVIDTKAGTLDPAKARSLEALARHAAHLLRIRQQGLEAARSEAALLELNETLVHDVESRTQEVDRLWDRAEDLLAVIDASGDVLRASPSWTRTLGHEGAALVGRRFVDVLHEDDRRTFVDALARCRGSDLPVGFEVRMSKADDGWRWMAWTWTPEADGELTSGVGRDVTEAKERQAALEATEAALRQSQKMEALGQLTGGLAHDFNNLLVGITGSLELLQLRVSQGRIAELDRYLVAAQAAAKRAAALTHRLLAFARRQTLDPKATDIGRLIADLDEMVRRTVGPQIVLDVVAAPGLWSGMVDANQLENAVLNLCINSRDAMPEGGRLTIAATNLTLDANAALDLDLAPGQYLALSVGDTGSGMDAEVVKRAFDPFFTTKPLGAGTGLGLSMVYGFARQSGGQVRIESTVGRGTTISLYLPRHVGSVAEVNEGAWAPLATGVGNDETVLIVDDEPTVRMLIAEVLEDLGYRSLEAQDGASGLKLLQSDVRIDLLITDVGLPGGLNGRQVADAARTLRPELQVLFITGYAEVAALSNLQMEDGMHVLTKPFSLDALSRRIGDMLRRDA